MELLWVVFEEFDKDSRDLSGCDFFRKANADKWFVGSLPFLVAFFPCTNCGKNAIYETCTVATLKFSFFFYETLALIEYFGPGWSCACIPARQQGQQDREKRHHWFHGRDCSIAVHGVPYSFGTVES
jgi:hypothetical protein